MIKKQCTVWIMILSLLLASGLIGCGAGDTDDIYSEQNVVEQDESEDMMEESLPENMAPSEEESTSESDETVIWDDPSVYDCSPVSFDLSDLPEMENKLYAQWEGNIYFRQYSDEDVEKGALWADFGNVPDTEKELMCLTPDGEITQVGTDYGCGTMFIVDGRLYSQRYTERGDSNEYMVYSCNLDGSDVKEYAAQEVLALRGSHIVCRGGGDSLMLTAIDTQTGKEKILVDREYNREAAYLEATEEEIFYYVQEKTGEDRIYDTVLYRVDYEGNIREVTTVTMAEWEELIDVASEYPEIAGLFPDGGYVQPIVIVQLTILGDDLYFSSGFYDGTAQIFQGGGIYHVKKDGSGREVLGATHEQFFYLYDDGMNRALYYDPLDYHSMHHITLLGEITQNIRLREPYQTYMKPYVYGSTSSVVFYPDTSGICYVLLTPRESDDLSIQAYADGNYNQLIRDMEYLNGKLFFRVTDVTYSQEESVGWRDGYVRSRTAYYCKDLESGEIRLLYEY